MKYFKIPHDLACLSNLMPTVFHASYSHHSDRPVPLRACLVYHSLSSHHSLWDGLPPDHLGLFGALHYRAAETCHTMERSWHLYTLLFSPTLFLLHSLLPNATNFYSFHIFLSQSFLLIPTCFQPPLVPFIAWQFAVLAIVVIFWVLISLHPSLTL